MNKRTKNILSILLSISILLISNPSDVFASDNTEKIFAEKLLFSDDTGSSVFSRASIMEGPYDSTSETQLPVFYTSKDYCKVMHTLKPYQFYDPSTGRKGFVEDYPLPSNKTISSSDLPWFDRHTQYMYSDVIIHKYLASCYDNLNDYLKSYCFHNFDDESSVTRYTDIYLEYESHNVFEYEDESEAWLDNNYIEVQKLVSPSVNRILSKINDDWNEFDKALYIFDAYYQDGGLYDYQLNLSKKYFKGVYVGWVPLKYIPVSLTALYQLAGIRATDRYIRINGKNYYMDPKDCTDDIWRWEDYYRTEQKYKRYADMVFNESNYALWHRGFMCSPLLVAKFQSCNWLQRISSCFEYNPLPDPDPDIMNMVDEEFKENDLTWLESAPEYVDWDNFNPKSPSANVDCPARNGEDTYQYIDWDNELRIFWEDEKAGGFYAHFPELKDGSANGDDRWDEYGYKRLFLNDKGDYIEVLSQNEYTGKKQKPIITVSYDGSLYYSGKRGALKVKYKNNKNSGTAEAAITKVKKNKEVSKTLKGLKIEFEIIPVTVSENNVQKTIKNGQVKTIKVLTNGKYKKVSKKMWSLNGNEIIFSGNYKGTIPLL